MAISVIIGKVVVVKMTVVVVTKNQVRFQYIDRSLGQVYQWMLQELLSFLV